VVVTIIAYFVALELKEKQGIFEIAIRYAFSGFAAMAPVMVAALFWKRSTKWGALAATLFVALSLAGNAALQGSPQPPPPSALPSLRRTSLPPPQSHQQTQRPISPQQTRPQPSRLLLPLPPSRRKTSSGKLGKGGCRQNLSRAPNGDVRFMNNYMTVVPMVFGSAVFMVLFFTCDQTADQ